jgi:hypothetical protein
MLGSHRLGVLRLLRRQGLNKIILAKRSIKMKKELEFEQEKMRERWSKRGRTLPDDLPSHDDLLTLWKTARAKSTKPNQSAKRARVAKMPLWKSALAKSARPTQSVKPTTGRNRNQERLALGFSLGVPPVRAGYSTATIEYACVCGVFSADPNKCPRCSRKR